ncbi:MULTISPECIES: M12 family metallopeptidase [Pseudomonas]|uniref:M12 family metallopeptidase n=1 Tax=Pseudomonas TaxID=286 RepID=UPI0006ACD028|nr:MULTISPECIES: M12 family metallopeptidase [Pseudomonas]NWE00985.1 peptidase M12 [Pseudomonas sp. IPO3749]NWF19002.1 peptidase M12 [Pseudomonas sp. IPO3749]
MINAAAHPATHFSPATTQSADLTTDAPTLSRHRRNIGEPRKYWPQNSTIKIALFDHAPDSEYAKAVKAAASEWLPHINLKFEFVAGNKGDVRIEAATTSGGHSAIGKMSNRMGQAIPSMTLPIDHKHPKFAYVVMHEFGHMLGAHHAHQHPDSNIPWNTEKTYEYYKKTHNMGKSEVDNNVLPVPKRPKYDLLPYDGDSVMHYEIKPDVTDGNWGQSETWSLSEGDIAWAKKAYPKEQPAESPVT